MNQQPQQAAGAIVAELSLVARLTNALGFDHQGAVPHYWAVADADLIVGRWQADLGLTAEEILHVAVGNAKAHGSPANGPKALTRAMQDYAAAKTAPPLEPTKGSPNVQRTATPSLADTTPEQINNSLASLARLCGCELRVSKDMAAKRDSHGAFLGYEPTGKILAIVKGSPEAIEAMRDRMAGAFAPATEDQVALWLAELDVIAPRRAAKATDDDLRLRAYLTRAAAYPADVVREAMLVRHWTWYPSWAELAKACDELTAHRAAVLAELDRQVEAELRAKALPAAEAATLTPEEAAARKAERARALGDLLESLTAKAAAEDAADAARAAARTARHIAAE